MSAKSIEVDNLDFLNAQSVYGIVFEIKADQVEGFRKMIAESQAKDKAEVVLIYNGQRRTCSFDELVRFMKGDLF